MCERLYVLNDAALPEVCHDLMRWAQWYNDETRRRLASTLLPGAWVTTVFLAIDRNGESGQPPLLYETTVFSTEHCALQGRTCRYATREQAMAGHDAMLAEVHRYLNQEPRNA